jgi:hypothetical protein
MTSRLCYGTTVLRTVIAFSQTKETMAEIKLTIRLAVGLTLGVAALVSGGFYESFGEEKSPDEVLVARVDKLIQAWQTTPSERRIDEIGWAKDIREALQLGQKHHRPIFLFTYSGSEDRVDAIALQRC